MENGTANFEQFEVYCEQAQVMYKPLEEKIKNYELKNFGSVSSKYDLTSDKIRSMYDKFNNESGNDSSTMFDFIRTELLQLIQHRKQFCKD